MTWSTREVAELAGTTLRTVRHYHDIGLLPAPERTVNGYKQYGVPHLLTLIRIRRLVDLGFPLSDVADLTDDTERPLDALRRLDAQLAKDMLRLQRNRDRIAVLLENTGHSAAFGADIASVSNHSFTSPDRLFMLVLARIVSPHILDVYLAMIEATRDDPVLAEFDSLTADDDEDTLEAVADRMRDHLSVTYAAFPALLDITAGAPAGRQLATRALQLASAEFYNSAQLDVLRRVSHRAGFTMQSEHGDGQVVGTAKVGSPVSTSAAEPCR